MSRPGIVRLAAGCSWSAAGAATLVILAAAMLGDGGSAHPRPDMDPAAGERDDARARMDAVTSADADAVPELIDLDEALGIEEAPDEIPVDVILPGDTVGADDASDELAVDLPDDASECLPDEGMLPPLLTQNAPLADVVDRAGMLARLPTSARCLLAGLATVVGDSMPAALALAIARAAVELTDAPASPAGLSAAARAEVEQLGALGLASAPEPGRIALDPGARVAGDELLAALPEVAADHLGDAALRWWLDFALGTRAAGAPALVREAAGLRGALLWAREHGRHRALLDLAQVLAPQLATSALGGLDERTCYEWAREAAATLGDAEGQLWAIHHLIRVLLADGETESARARLDDALALSAHEGRQAERREELHTLGMLDAQHGDVESAWSRHQEALTLARHSGDARAQREELHSLAVLDAQGGRVVEARTGFETALDLARTSGDVAAERSDRHALAVLDAREGRLDDARAGFNAAMELARRLGDRRSERSELHELAALDARAGAVEAARAGFEAALALARELGDAAAESTELQSLGFRDLNMGRLYEARTELREALALARENGQALLIARALWSCAELDARLDLRDDARTRFLEALDLYDRLGDPDAHNDYIRLRLRELGHTG